MSLHIVLMAAGKGTRMKSDRPKVLHPLAGRPLLQHVLATVAPFEDAQLIVVTGHGAEQVEAEVLASPLGAQLGPRLHFVRQSPQLGTGHAVQQALPHLGEHGTTLVLNGDTPLIEADTLRALLDACGGERLALLTVRLDDPTGYGRIQRNGLGQIQGIVEHKDANEAQRALHEVYTGVMAAPSGRLRQWLGRLRNDNAQGEYYLTDVVALAVADGVPVLHASAHSETEVLGVNSPLQLADLERRFQHRQALALLEAGVRLADPARLDVRGRLTCAQDVSVDINCLFEGDVLLGAGVRVGAHCVLAHCVVEAGAVIHPFTLVEGSPEQPVRVGPNARVGPYARLRPGTLLARDVHVGNFVEIKNSTLHAGAKANHLAYVGDAEIGPRSNYGAGSITANYDGVNKFRTHIGADVRVGSNCVLVAPVHIGDEATLGAGSTITQDAPAGQLTVARGRQRSLPHWKRPVKAPKV